MDSSPPAAGRKPEGRKPAKTAKPVKLSPKPSGSTKSPPAAVIPASVPTPARVGAANPSNTRSGPGAAEVYYQQGNLYLKEKKVALAIEEFKKCLAADPGYGLAYRSLGVSYMLLGREKSAVDAYERFVREAPTHRDAPKVRQIIDDYYRRNPNP